MPHRPILVATLLATVSCARPAPVVAPAPAPPIARLGVLVVVDQLPTRLLAAPSELYTAGLARLTGEQASVGVARHPHATTFTGPGHATLSTGTTPARHGIVANVWYLPDEPEGTRVYCGDPALLLAPTLADRVVGAGGQVAAVSLKDRGASLTGGTRAQLVSWFDSQAMRFTGPLSDLDVDRWTHEPWTALHPEAYEAIAGRDDDPNEVDRQGYGITFPHPAPDASPGHFLVSPFAGEALTDAAISAVDRLGLGSDEVPDLLTVSYSQTDYIGHTFTAESWEAMDGMVRLDLALGRLLDHLDATVGPDHYTLALTSDHGAIVAEGADRIPTDAVRNAATTALHSAGFAGEVHVQAPGIWMPVSVRENPQHRATAARAVAQAVGEVEGIEAAWAWRHDGVDGPFADAVRASLHEERSGDVYYLLAYHALEDYPGAEGRGTTHGTPYDEDTRVPLLLYGAGISPGEPREDFDTRQVAPTLATAMGLPAPAADGLAPIDTSQSH